MKKHLRLLAVCLGCLLGILTARSATHTITKTAGIITIPAYVAGDVLQLQGDTLRSPDWTALRALTTPFELDLQTGNTSIPSQALQFCKGITGLTIPKSVTSIGKSAFSGCTGLAAVVIEDGEATLDFGMSSASNSDKAFYGCPIETLYLGRNISYYSLASPFKDKPTLKQLTIGISVTSIGSFSGCTGLTEVTIPNSVTSIEESAFKGCTGLTAVTIPNSVTSIGYSAFKGCTGLTEVAIEDGEIKLNLRHDSFSDCPIETLYLGRNAYSCWSNKPTLKQLTISNSVTSIGSFSGCTGLTEVIIPNSVTSIGNSAFKGCTGLTEVTIPNSVTSIGGYAFSGCTGLTGTLTIPNSVTSIGYSAFFECTGLTTVTIPNSVTSIGQEAFSGCTALTEVIIEDGETTLDFGTSSSSNSDKAFVNCPIETLYLGRNISYDSLASPFKDKPTLQQLTISNSVTSIGQEAFSGCTALTEIIIEDGETLVDFGTSYASNSDKAFSGCPIKTLYLGRNISYYYSFGSPFRNKPSLQQLTIGNSVTSIGNSAFYGCTSLTTVTIGNSVTSIEESAFQGCTGLTTLTIGNSVTSIGSSAFSYCTGLKEVHYLGTIADWCRIEFEGYASNPLSNGAAFYVGEELVTELIVPDEVTSIGSYAFYNCTGLTGTLTIPNSVKEIGYGAFHGCTGLTGTLTIPNSVTSIGKQAFDNCTGLTTLTIPNSVTSIEEAAFSDCTGLTEVTIPNSVTSIEEFAFSGCIGLTEVIIPNSVKEIGYSAFKNCTGLATVTIPNSVTSIEESAFSGCTGLTTVTIPNSVTSIGSYTFQGCTALTEVIIEDGETTLDFGTYSDNSDKAFVNCPIETLYLGRNISYYYSFGSPFKDKPTLKQLTIGNSVTSIGSYTFQGCTALTEVIIEDGEATLDFGTSSTADSYKAFSGCPIKTLYLGRNISYYFSYSSYSYSPFEHKPSLQQLTIGNSVTSIGKSAFNDCTGLTTLTIGNSVTSIEESAFQGCTGLKEVHYLGTIADWCRIEFEGYASNPLSNGAAFYVGEELVTELIIPDEVTSIGSYAFRGCTGLTTVTIGNSVTSIGNSAFSGCTSLTTLTIPNSVTSIGNQAFYGCKSLTTLTIPNSVTSIGRYVFEDCTGLAAVVIEDGEATLDFGTYSDNSDKAFARCPIETLYLGRNISYYSSASPFKDKLTLKQLTIGNSVTSIGENDFSGCNQVRQLKIMSVNPLTITSSTFPDYYAISSVYIPKESFVQYIHADIWKEMYLIGFDDEGALYSLTQVHASGGNLVTVNGETGEFVLSPLEEDITVALTEDIGGGCVVINETDRTEELKEQQTLVVPSKNINHIYTYNHDSDSRFVVHVGTSGTLMDSIKISNLDKVKELIVSGDLNGTDIAAIRRMPGLTLLDMSEANIVEGGVPYYEDYTTASNQIGDYFFKDKDKLSMVRLPQSATDIGSYVFSGCADLSYVFIGNSVNSIGSYAFQGCTGLTEVTIPNSVTSIGKSAFSGCTGLAAVVIEDGEATLDFASYSDSDKAFVNCPIETLYLGRNISYYYSFGSPFKDKPTLKQLTIGNSVTSIGSYAFQGCTALTEVIIEDGEATLDFASYSDSDKAFVNCPIETLYLGRNISYYSSASPFKDKPTLKQLTISNSVTSIGSSAFAGCGGLMEINSANPTPPTITTNTFEGVDKENCTLYVPTGSTTVYWLHSMWQEFFDIQEKEYRQPQALIFDLVSNKTYGDADFALEASSDAGLPVVFTSSDESVLFINGSMASIKGAGEVTVTASCEGDPYHFAASVNRKIEIEKAPLTVQASDATREYGDVNPAFELTYEGFKNDETESVLTKAPEAATIADIYSAAGQYAIEAIGGEAANYELTYKLGTLTVTKAPLTVQASDATREYGDVNPAFELTYEGFKNDETESVLAKAPEAATIADIYSAAGQYAIEAIGGEAANYELVYKPGILTIEKATLTISVQDETREAGLENPTFTLVYTGFKHSDSEADLDKLPTATCAADTDSPVGSYDIVLSGGSDNNYTYVLENGTLVVTPMLPTALHDAGQANLAIYPNPATDYIFLQSAVAIDKVEIYSRSGACALQQDRPAGQMDISRLPAGLYFIKLYIGNTTCTKKLVIDR